MIVRELVTKLSFVFNRAGLDTFERAVKGFKNNIVFTAGEIASAVKESFEFLHNLAQSRINLKDMADFAGITTEEFVAMRNAAQKMGVQTENFDQALSGIAQSLKEATVGAGEFFRIIQETGEFRMPKFGQEAKNIRNFFEDLFNYIDKIENRSEKLRTLQNILKTDRAATAQFLRLIERGRDAYVDMIEKERPFAAQLQQQEAAALRLQQAVDRFDAAWVKAKETLVGSVLPVLANVLELFNAIADKIGQLFDAMPKGFTGLIPNLGLESFTGLLPNISKFFGGEEAVKDVSVNNSINIQIDVPPGTTEEQASFMANEIRQQMQDVINQNARQMISSNSMVE